MPKENSIRIFVPLIFLTLMACAHVPEISGSISWKDRPLEAESIYRERLAKLAARERLDYDVMAAVPGSRAEDSSLEEVVSEAIAADAIEQVFDYAADNNSSAILIWHDGNLIAERYFDTNDVTTPLVSKSLSKPLSAVAIGRAIALGKIESLDQKISAFIPEWKDTPKATITIRQMLAMRSGLLEQSFSMDQDSPFPRAYLDPYHGQYIIDEYPLTEPPGTKYSYNNATADLVAIVIERATGRQYEEFIGTEILQAINAPGGSIWLNREGGLAHSGCCMLLPAQSWLKLAILLSHDGRVNNMALLPAGFVDEMRRGSLHNPHYGLGVWLGSPYAERRGFMGPNSLAPKVLHSAPYLADDVFLFDGNGNQVAYIVPSKKLVILRMGSSPPKGSEWDNSYIPNIILSSLTD